MQQTLDRIREQAEKDVANCHRSFPPIHSFLQPDWIVLYNFSDLRVFIVLMETGKRVKSPRCRATVSESGAEGFRNFSTCHCGPRHGKAGRNRSRKPGDRRNPLHQPFRVQRRCAVLPNFSCSLVSKLFGFSILVIATFFARAAEIKVSVIDPDSRPVAGTQVRLLRGSSIVATQSTTASGEAKFEDISHRELRVEVLAPGFAPAPKAVHAGA